MIPSTSRWFLVRTFTSHGNASLVPVCSRTFVSLATSMADANSEEGKNKTFSYPLKRKKKDLTCIMYAVRKNAA